MEKEMSDEYFVSAGEANPQGELSVSVLVNKIIELATAHANSLHIGNPDMREINGGWVLGRLTVDMLRWPPVNSAYRITTWIEGWNRHYSCRCFEVADTEGNVYGYCRTLWMIINLDSHENIGLAHFSLPEGLVSPRECPIPLQKKHQLNDASRTVMRRIEFTDIDYYRHVNTVRWIELLLDCYTLRHFDEMMLSRLEISFMREGHYGDDIGIRIYRRPDSVDEFALVREDTPLVHARLSFACRG